MDRYFIKEKIEDSSIDLPFVKSKNQLADILTKVVTGKAFTRGLSKLSIGDPTAHLEGSVRILLSDKQKISIILKIIKEISENIIDKSREYNIRDN